MVHIKLADVLHDHPIILQPIRLVADDVIFLCEIGARSTGARVRGEERGK